MILTCSEMRALEERAFADGIAAEALMEDAGGRIAEAVRQFFAEPGHCVAFIGKGHNGGDALVAARRLAHHGWSFSVRAAFPIEQWAPLTRLQHDRLPESGAKSGPVVVLDGLLGIGAGGALREPILGACSEINRMAREEGAHIFALDLPTGLDGDTGTADAEAVRADTTLTIGFPKAGLLADGAINHAGRLAVLPLEELTKRADRSRRYDVVATPAELAPLLPRRAFDTHKGQCGRIAIVAGSRGFVGAAAMCAEGALRGGAGLVTLLVERDFYEIAATRVTPEVMVKAVDSPSRVIEERADVIAIGPGLGLQHASGVLDVINRAAQPMVVDADAINALAADPHTLDRAAGPRLLTPHPGEMVRLDSNADVHPRRFTAEAFTHRWSHALLFKGARTIVGQRGKPLSYNSTGHPGLATGGVGDVMTGLVAALAGQGLSLYDAARVGSWIVGRAAERAIFSGAESAETLRPTALLDHLGGAFRDLRSGCV